MIRCAKCIMPKNYPGISFDAEGVCNFCRKKRHMDYKGEEALKHSILEAGRNSSNLRYDCLVGFSGGRDSSYLLYLIKKVLKLRALAVTVDNGYLPTETKENISTIADRLQVDLEIVKYDYLEKSFRSHLLAWLHHPTPAMINALCVGCRLGIKEGLYKSAKKHNIPVIISGGTPFEGNHFKTNLLRTDPLKKTKKALVFGYCKQLISNYKWITNPKSFILQMKEANAIYNQGAAKKLKKSGIRVIYPYQDFIHWQEMNIINTLETELKWKRNANTKSTWRGDCDIALIKLYLYKKLLGFNDKDDSLSDLIRDGQLTREEALSRLEEEQYISESVIKNILDQNNIDYNSFNKVLQQVEQKK